eukprot:5797167-Prymnesium_polylepis.1
MARGLTAARTSSLQRSQGLEQFASNPMLKGMAEAIPGLQQVCVARESTSVRREPSTMGRGTSRRTHASCPLAAGAAGGWICARAHDA